MTLTPERLRELRRLSKIAVRFDRTSPAEVSLKPEVALELLDELERVTKERDELANQRAMARSVWVTDKNRGGLEK